MMRLCPIKYGGYVAPSGPTYEYKYFFFAATSDKWSVNGDEPEDIATLPVTVMPSLQSNNKKSNTGAFAFGETLIHTHSTKLPFISTDAGDNWFQGTWPTGAAYSYSMAAYCGGYYWIGGAGAWLERTTDFSTWTQVSTGVNSTRSRLATIGDTMVHSGSGDVRTSVNGGASWTTYTVNVSSSSQHVFTDGSAFVIVPGNALTAGGMKRSLDGITWTVITGLPSFGASSEITHSCASDSVFLIFFGPTYIRSTDGGLTWSAYTLPSSRVAFCSHYADGNYIVGTSVDKLLVSGDGITWSEYSPPSGYGVGFSGVIASVTEV